MAPRRDNPKPKPLKTAAEDAGKKTSGGVKEVDKKNKMIWPLSGTKGSVGDGFGVDRGDHRHAGVDIAAPMGTKVVAVLDGKVSSAGSVGGYGNRIVVDHGAGTQTTYNHLSKIIKTGGHVDQGEVIGKVGSTGKSTGPHLHFEVVKNGDPVDPMPYLKGADITTGEPGASSSSSGDGGAAEIIRYSKAAVFATELQFASMTDVQEAILLQGQKSLLNDKPLFPFIQQLCQGSLRQFQSAPNGDFYAFFADYFGAWGKRTPYWEIRDIEILDGRIDLSDDALVTHQYVVGDTIPGGGVTIWEKMLTAGVVNIFNAGVADFINVNPAKNKDNKKRTGDDPKETKKEKKTREKEEAKEWTDMDTPLFGGRDEVIQFMKHYGARPNYEEAAFIRSPWFEVFLAFQLFMLAWSRQFVTTFTFTFMPELYPGGLVAFPDHGFQCYIEEVTHAWDYEAGFTTQANLSAPAALKGAEGAENMSMGMIRSLAGRFANSEGDLKPKPPSKPSSNGNLQAGPPTPGPLQPGWWTPSLGP